MWIILLFVYVCATLPNNAQEFTSFEAQTATETYASSDVNSDPTRPPVILSIRNGRTKNVDRTITQNSERPLYYSSDWQGMLMPIGFNSDRDTEKYVNENERSYNYQLVPTFLRRPDVEVNNTGPSQYSLIEENNQFSNVPASYYPFVYFQSNSNSTADSLTPNVDQIYADTLPIENVPRNAGNFQSFDLYRNTESLVPPAIPFQSTSQSSSTAENIETNADRKQIPSSADTLPTENVHRNVEHYQPFDFFRNFQSIVPAAIPFQSTSQSSFSSNIENIEINREQKQIPSSGLSEIVNTDSINSESIKPSSTDNSNPVKEIPNPEFFYGNNQRYLPPMIPAYFSPYPFVPFQRSDAFRPVLPYPSNIPNFDRESGSEVNERIQVPPQKVLSGDVADQTVENIPSETTASIIPPQQLPSVVPGYPFGAYLPRFAPPLIPNISPSGFPLRPLPLPRNIQGGNAIPEVLIPPPPVVPIKPITGVVPEVLPQPDSLIPEEQKGIITGAEVNSVESLPEEDLNAIKTPYEFGFDMSDGQGNDQHRKEVSDIAGVVRGSYGFRNINGTYRVVEYIADINGFRANIRSNEPGVASSGSANVVVFAERPPPTVTAEGRNAAVPILIDPNAELVPAGDI